MRNPSRRLIAIALCGGAVLVSSPARGEGEPGIEIAADQDTGIAEDPNLDHAWLMPTAMTQPRGAWKVSDTELFIFGLAYGVTDDFTVSAGAIVPVSEANVGWLTGKYRFLRAGRFSLAAYGSTAFFYQEGHSDSFGEQDPGERDLTQSLGLAGSFCIDAACRSVLSAYGGGLFGVGDRDERFGFLGASAIMHLGGPLKLMAKLDRGNQVGWAQQDGAALFWYGVRLSGRAVAVDLGVVEGIGGDAYDDGENEVARLPWVKFAYRAL